MAVVQKTYAELGDLWGVSKEAARKKVEGLHLPRRLGNDGRTRVTVDLAEVTHTPQPKKIEADRRPEGDREEGAAGDHVEADGRPDAETLALLGQVSALKGHVSTLQAALDAERERAATLANELHGGREAWAAERALAAERADKMAGELTELGRRFTASVDDARGREQALADKLDAVRQDMAELRARPWWRRLAG